MSEKNAPREEVNPPAPTAAESAPPKSTEATTKGQAEQFHKRYVELFKESLAQEGEIAYARWGMPLFHSLSDEDAEAQRLALGVEPQDALDFYNRGCLLAHQEDPAGAAKAFARAAQLDPALAEAVYNQALALEQADDKSGALETWQDYLARFGENEDAVVVRQHLESLQQEA